MIRDLVNVDNKYIANIDMAIEIKTENNIYTFYRGWYFSECIYFANNTEFSKLYPIEKVISDWNNDNEYSVKVERKVISL